jgi:hypothetical protein
VCLIAFRIQNGLKEGDASSPEIFIFLEYYTILLGRSRKKEVRQRLSGTHQLLAYADNVNLLRYSIDTKRKE